MRNGGIQIRVSDMLFILQKRWKTIVGLTLLGLLFGLALSGMSYVQSSFQTYEIKGSYAITTLNAQGKYINGNDAANNNDFYLAEDMVDAVKYLIRSDRVMQSVIENQKLLGVTAEDIRSALSISQHHETQILEMTLVWRTPAEGLEIWNAIVSAANQELPRVLQLGQLVMVNASQAEQAGVAGASSLKMWMLLAVLGFAAGVGLAMMELLVHPTLNNVKDVESVLGLETLGVIPQDHRFFSRQGSLLNKESGKNVEVVQNYSAAAYILRNRMGTKEKHHCFYVTSTAAREGKTTAAAHLAVQLSDMEYKTLLIDFNTRNPGLGALFLHDVDYAHSLNALYRGEATEEEAITSLTGHLDLLPTVLEHTAIPMDSMVEELFRRLADKYEYVIIDAAAVGQAADTLSLNRVANAALFVVGYDHATIPDVQNALEKLDKSGIRVIGCVVNGVKNGKSGGKPAEKKPSEKRTSRKKREEAFFRSAPEKELIDELKKPAVEKAEPEEKKAAPKPRNVMDALLADSEKGKGHTDDDVMNALLQMPGEEE